MEVLARLTLSPLLRQTNQQSSIRSPVSKLHQSPLNQLLDILTAVTSRTINVNGVVHAPVRVRSVIVIQKNTDKVLRYFIINIFLFLQTGAANKMVWVIVDGGHEEDYNCRRHLHHFCAICCTKTADRIFKYVTGLLMHLDTVRSV